MSDPIRTGIYVAVAVALALIAGFCTPGSAEPEVFSDAGELFFPEFTDPTEVTSLEVWEFDAETGAAVPFAVEKRDGRWTIPSHHGYPADAEDRMAKAAGLVIGLRKDAVRSDRREDHSAFGVVDPTETGLELEGRGTRVTFKGSGGEVLADLIVGKEVEEREGMRYVRLPGKKRTYAAELDAELSTDFEDWIERDLLKAGSWDMTEIVFDNYSVDESRGVLVPGEKVVMSKEDYDWKLADLAEDEEMVREKVNEVVDTLADLKIVGVRPKPEGLTARLEKAQGIARELLMQSLARRGFFLSRGKLYSNEGDLVVHTKKGVVYTLKFGEIVYGAGDAVTAGKEDEAQKTADGGGDESGKDAEAQGPKKPEGSHRYLMITAHFDETLLERPEGEPLPEEHIDKRAEAREEIEKIVAAVETYREKNGKLPEALADLTLGDDAPLKELVQDPWGNDFAYERAPKPAEGEAKKGEGEKAEAGDEENEPETEESFVVLSFAEDGEKGGEGVGRDVRSDALDVEDELKRTFDAHQEFAGKVAEGEKEAESLTERFGPWYYVIAAESFDKLKKDRADLVKKKEKEDEAEEKDGGEGDRDGGGK